VQETKGWIAEWIEGDKKIKEKYKIGASHNFLSLFFERKP
jgi:hypothetical protein